MQTTVFPFHFNPTKNIDHMWTVEKTMAGLNNQGTVVALKIDAELKSQSGSYKGIQTALSFGLKQESSSPHADTIKVVSNMEVKASQSPVYEITFTSNVERPHVNNRWNKDRMVNEALNMVFNGQIEYGYQTLPKKTVRIHSKMAKSEEQKQSVKGSAEFQRCSQEEQQGKHLADVCELTRHQAASIDEIQAELEMPINITKYPFFYRVGDILKAYFIGQLWTEESSYTSPTTLKLMAKVSRVGEEAQLEAEIAGHKYRLVNIRMPKILKGVFPVSMRNPFRYNLVQKLTRNQLPASCRVEPEYISTFDNKNYGYQLNDCWHLLFNDCSKKIPVAVLAKSLKATTPQQKEVKILAGPAEVIMTPKSSVQLIISLNIDGHQEEIQVQPGQIMPIIYKGNEIMEILRYQDNVYLVKAFKEALWVLFDGERLEVSGSYLLKSRSCGLCGDLNGENTADLKTPRQCIMSHPRFAAYSYMIQESCQGIPSQYKPQYEQEKANCVKEEVIPTPLAYLAKIVATKASELTKPMISQHLVQRQPRSGQVCISVQKVKVCSKISQEETEEPRPVKVAPKKVEYVCYDATMPKAQQLEQLAKSGESLDLEVTGKAIAFSMIVYEPIVCQWQSNQIGI